MYKYLIVLEYTLLLQNDMFNIISTILIKRDMMYKESKESPHC